MNLDAWILNRFTSPLEKLPDPSDKEYEVPAPKALERAMLDKRITTDILMMKKKLLFKAILEMYQNIKVKSD